MKTRSMTILLSVAVAAVAAQRTTAADAANPDGPPPPSPRPVAVADEETVAAMEKACAALREGFPEHPRVLWKPGKKKLSAYHSSDRWLITYEEMETWTLVRRGSDYWRGNVEPIADVHEQFARAGIEMILIVVPPRLQIYPEIIPEFRQILSTYGGKPVLVPCGHQEFIEALRERGVQAIDLTRIFLANRGEPKADLTDFRYPLYGGHGQHWMPYGAYVTAQLVREVVKDRPWYRRAEKIQPQYTWGLFTGDRFLARFHGLHKTNPVFQKREFFRAYGPKVSFEWGAYTEKTTPVTAVGDSYLGNGDFEGHLSGALRIPVAAYGRNQLYNSSSLGQLTKRLADEEFRRHKKLVIWETGSMELHRGFRKVDLGLPADGTPPPEGLPETYGPWWPPRPGEANRPAPESTPDASGSAAPTKEAAAPQGGPPAKIPRSVVEARLVDATRPGARLTDTVYAQCLVEYVYEVRRVVEGPKVPERISVLHWGLIDFKPQREILDRKVGKTYRLALEPFAAHRRYKSQRQESTVEDPGLDPYLDVGREPPEELD